MLKFVGKAIVAIMVWQILYFAWFLVAGYIVQISAP
jgi:hypothetical protein